MLKAYLSLIRPFNCFFTALTVLFGAFFKLGITANPKAYFAAISASLIAAAGYAVNDYFDLPIDIINKPNRPLPSQKISPRSAFLFANLLFLLGIFASLLTANFYCILIAFINSFALFFYAKNLKQSYLLGNILVAYAAASTFLFGAFANGNLTSIIPVTVFAFLFTVCREVVKDAEDIIGDKKFGAKTFAVIHGKKASNLLSSSFAIAIVTYSVILFKNNFASLIKFSISVNLPLILMHLYLIKSKGLKKYKKISALMKADMLILLITLALI